MTMVAEAVGRLDSLTEAAMRAEVIRAMLHDPAATFSRDQVLDLVAMAIGTEDPQWWYRAGLDDGARAANRELEQWEQVQSADRAIATERYYYRQKCDATARTPRPGDYRGGPVEVWPATRPDLEYPKNRDGSPLWPAHQIRMVRGVPVWRD